MMAFYRSNVQSPFTSLFPADYAHAREQFLAAADSAGCVMHDWPIDAIGPDSDSLCIDVACWGAPTAKRCLLLSSGLHGTEGPFGTAVQIGFLRLLSQLPYKNTSVVFLHALNPFGYAWIRRANENNVDLNRNFLLPGEVFQGSHPLYHHVYRTFDPHRPKRIYENFYLMAGWLIARHSRAALQTSLPVGQYDYPQGLFFGGHGPSITQSLLQEELRHAMPEAAAVTHLDFHTGLGRWADYRLLIDVDEQHEDAQWFHSWARPGSVETASHARTAYLARGSIGPWLRQVVFRDVRYRYAGAEFGTYGQVKVLQSLVDELQAHYAYEADDPRLRRAKARIKEAFVPKSQYWRETSAQKGVELCQRSMQAIEKGSLSD